MMHSFNYCAKKIGEVGEVAEVKEFLVKADGLPGATMGEAITFASGQHGRVMGLGQTHAEILVLSRLPVQLKTKVARAGFPLSISAGNGILGHTVDTFGNSLTDRRHKSGHPQKRPIEIPPLGIWRRTKVSRFFETGVVIVDLLIPLGHGQRELVIGERKTGKTHLLLQTMISQVRKGTICIYCAVGKRKTEIKLVENFLRQQDCLSRSLIIAADSYASSGEIFLSPYTAMTFAEYFRDQGQEVLVILDDLTTHAKYYREISLLAGHFPGRESYPGDIFHIHSKLLERAGSFAIDGQEHSITCLPVAESTGGDITGYIQTNLMSATDGHIYFDNELFSQGIRPAINIFLSVTRVGRQTLTPLFRDLTNNITLLLKNYEDAQRFLRFGSELSGEVQNTLETGDRLFNFFRQTSYEPIPLNLQALLVSLIWLNLWDGKNSNQLIKSISETPQLAQLCTSLVDQAKSLAELNNAVSQSKEQLRPINGIKII